MEVIENGVSVTWRMLRDVKAGEYIRRKPDGKVYMRGGFDRASNRYACADTADISRAVYLRGDTLVCVDFTY